MRCPFCSHEDTQVKDSRPSEDNAAIRRRRECTACDARFTTFERVQLRELTVVKVDGRRESFEREKLLRSLKLALRRRPVEAEAIERMASDIIRHLELAGEAEVTTKTIGEYAMRVLSGIDSVAYVRYASVYKNFHEVSDYTSFLGALKDNKKKKQA